MTTLVLGLDGASWRLIDRYIEAGVLPNLARVKREGSWAKNRSCLPPVTSPNWKCYSTGKNPGKLGVFWWETIDTGERSIEVPDSTSYGSAEVWDYLGDEGKRSLVVNMPTTFPPRPIDGVMVSGGPDCGDTGYTYPEELEKRLEKRGYSPNMSQSFTSFEDTGPEVQEALGLIEKRFDLIDDLVEEEDPDLVHLTIFYVNVLQHFFWDDEPTREAWRLIDRRLGYLMKRFDTVLLMSDHGSGPIDTVFYVNRWLEREGFLKTRSGGSDLMRRVGLSQKDLLSAAKRTGVEGVAKKLVPQSVLDLFPQERGGVKREEKLERVVWEETRAVASGQGLIYVVDGEGYEETRDELIERLEELESPFSGEPVARRAYRKEEVYEGKYVDAAPDVVFDQGRGIHTSDVVGKGDVFGPPDRWRGENYRDGIFAAWGRGVKSAELGTVDIVDIAPTVLHLTGCAVPRDVDGEVLDIFEEGSEPDEREPTYRDPLELKGSGTDGDDLDVRGRLEALGYLE